MATKTTKREVKQTPVDTVEKTVETPVKEKPVKKQSVRRIPLDIEVPCMSNVKSPLVYISTRMNGLGADWDEFGSIQYLDIRELMQMRNTQKRFFDDNWIVIKDTDDGEYTAEDIYKFLRVDDKYGDYYDADNIDNFFGLTPTQMKEKVEKLSSGMKELLTIVALDKFETGEIDSIKTKEAIKEALGIKDEEE